MYLSHPVRRMRANPGEGDVSLVVEFEAADADPPNELGRAVEDAGGTVERSLGYDCWLVDVPESAIEALCAIENVERIETAATLDLGVDDDSTKTS
jgi:hypothetical protein